MSDVRALENAVRALPPDQLAECRRWFAEFDLAAWERKIENDLSFAKLDALLAAQRRTTHPLSPGRREAHHWLWIGTHGDYDKLVAA